MSYAAKVRRGVELLDREIPGWHERIDLETLEVISTSHCVLGQLFEDFYVGYDDFLPHPRIVNVYELGFDADTAGLRDKWAEYPSNCATLTRLWAYVVRTRQAAS